MIDKKKIIINKKINKFKDKSFYFNYLLVDIYFYEKIN